jgi:hypothetical protein
MDVLRSVRACRQLLQASATIVGVFLPLTAVVFYLALSIFTIVDPQRRVHVRAPEDDETQTCGILTRPASLRPQMQDDLRSAARSGGYLASRSRRYPTAG